MSAFKTERVKLQYGLGIARFIDRLFYADECTVAIVYGGYLGTGKSAYCFKGMAEALGSHPGFPDNKPNYEAVKKFVVFPPRDFVERSLSSRHKEKVICWDDMGLHLFALDWYDPFVKATTKYFNVARSDWGLILGNTPSPKMIVKRIQAFPSGVRIKIRKATSEWLNSKKPRIATAYRIWESPDLKKTGVTTQGMWIDKYFAMLPDSFYDWYKPIRDSYAQQAKERMLQQIEKIMHKKAKKGEMTEDAYRKLMPETSRMKELIEVTINRFGELEDTKQAHKEIEELKEIKKELDGWDEKWKKPGK